MLYFLLKVQKTHNSYGYIKFSFTVTRAVFEINRRHIC